MKLNIAQNLRKYRKERGLTQEQLAKELAISAQSVSKWECGDGYPDIELLPNIANHLKISVDALLGNDSEAQKEDIELFWKKYYSREGLPEGENWFERLIRLAEEYWRKYPNEYRIASVLVREICSYRKKLDENRTLLYEAAEKILGECQDQLVREETLRNVCCACTDEEFERWNNRCTHEYRSCRGEVMEQRMWEHEQTEAAICQRALNDLKIVSHLLQRAVPNHSTPEQAAAMLRKYRRIMKAFADTDDTVPMGWLSYYARCGIYLAATRFAVGEKEDGYRFLEESLDLYERWYSIPEDTLLEFGDSDLFGGIRTRKGKRIRFILPDGREETDLSYFSLRSSAESVLDMISSVPKPNWGWYCGVSIRWFDDVKEEERFLRAAERAGNMNPYPFGKA